jgi:hypothetical protein
LTYQSSLAAFLGDSNFPQMIMSASKGERILRYQDLYKRYSRLALSKDFDRPYALDGLQARLLAAFETNGGFGIFDGAHLRRSLLWSRGEGVNTMARIAFPADRSMAVPSWSWMAYTGGIDYLHLEFNEVVWMDLKSPWAGDARVPGSRPMSNEPTGIAVLGAMAQVFDLSKAGAGEDRLIYDRPEAAEAAGLKCVVLGVKIERKAHDARRSFVLIVAPTRDKDEVYTRVGVGYLPGKCIAPAGVPIGIE